MYKEKIFLLLFKKTIEMNYKKMSGDNSYGRSSKPSKGREAGMTGLSRTNMSSPTVKKSMSKTVSAKTTPTRGKSSMASRPPRELMGATVTAKGYKHVKQMAPAKKTPGKGIQMVTVGGKDYPKKTIDSMMRSNPGLSKYVGSGYTGSGGRQTYSGPPGEVLKSALKKKK